MLVFIVGLESWDNWICSCDFRLSSKRLLRCINGFEGPLQLNPNGFFHSSLKPSVLSLGNL